MTATVLSTKWMTVQVDKVVSSIYFLIILVVVLFAITSQGFSENLSLLFSPSTNKTISSKINAVVQTKIVF